jgi:hypothetical protein
MQSNRIIYNTNKSLSYATLFLMREAHDELYTLS